MTGRVRELVQRVRATIDWRARDRELDDELASHLEAATTDYLRQGLSYEDASRRARIDFGSVALAREQHREARGIGFVDTLSADILYAFRRFGREPLAALTIVATVALGLGLVAVVFTIYNLLVLRPDAVRRPDELFAVTLQRWTGPDTDERVSLARPDLEAMRAETRVFTDITAMLDTAGLAYLEGRFARQMFVSGNFFQALGVQAALGRSLLPRDDEPSAGRLVIALSHTGWHKLFRADPGVIGRRVLINGAPHEIVGVMPDGFRGLGITPPDYWAPLAADVPLAEPAAGPERPHPIEVIGRLTPGMSSEAAAAALSAWASGRAEFKAPAGRPIKVSLTPRHGTLPREGVDLLFAPLFFAFGLILLIGCANVANLLLARGVTRRREIGIRLSLGASRPRIIRQLLTESLLLSLAAALCSVLVARLFLDGALYAVIDHAAAGDRAADERLQPRRPEPGLACGGVPGGGGDRVDGVLRARPGLAGDARRPRADDARRGDTRCAPARRAARVDRRPGRRFRAPVDLRRDFPARGRRCRDEGPRDPDERHVAGDVRRGTAAGPAAPGAGGRSPGREHRGAADAEGNDQPVRTRHTRRTDRVGGAAGVRVVRLLRGARRRSGAGARLPGHGTRGRGRHHRVRDHRASFLAQGGRYRSARPPRGAVDRTGCPTDAIRPLHGGRRRPRVDVRIRARAGHRPERVRAGGCRQPRITRWCCACAATRSRCARRCWSASRGSIPPRS